MNNIIPTAPATGALSAEHYETFERERTGTVSQEILSEDEHELDDPSFWAAIYSDLLQKMTPTAADEALSLKAGTVAAAIKRNEIKPYQFSERKVYVTPCLIGKWAYTHKRRLQSEQLPK